MARSPESQTCVRCGAAPYASTGKGALYRYGVPLRTTHVPGEPGEKLRLAVGLQRWYCGWCALEQWERQGRVPWQDALTTRQDTSAP